MDYCVPILYILDYASDKSLCALRSCVNGDKLVWAERRRLGRHSGCRYDSVLGLKGLLDGGGIML